MSAPKVITGVLRPEPLRELSALLGVEVLDVERYDRPGDGRRTWYLQFAAAPETAYPFPSAFLRSPARLNTWRVRVAQGQDRPPLTKDQCCRVLALMHEHVESKTENTYTEGMGH